MSLITVPPAPEDTATAFPFDRYLTRPQNVLPDAPELECVRLTVEVMRLNFELARATAELAAANLALYAPSAASLFLAMERARQTARSGGQGFTVGS